MKRIKYLGRRLKKTAYARRGLSALLCVCMILSMVNLTATGIPARADDPPAEMPSFDLEDITNYEKALHFLIRHWHMDEDKTAQYQGGTTLQSGGRYITVTEGYIIPAADGDVKYRFYVVNQGTGKLSEMDPDTFPARSNYVESMDPATGKIVLTPYFVLLGEDPVEQFAGWSISTGHDAVTYQDANGGTDERLIITYKANVHLVKGHAFYISAGEIVEGSVLKSVFGGEEIAFDLEKDVDWGWVFTQEITDTSIDGKTHAKDSVAVDDKDVPYTELNLPPELRPYVEWMQIHNTNQGLHTDKTAVDTYEDGRKYDVDLKAWYTAGYAPVVGMVLDASGSMGFAADIPDPIQVTKGTDVYEKLEGKIGQIQREKAAWDETHPLVGFYEFRNGGLGGSGYGSLYRLWYFNSAKDDYRKYNTIEMFDNANDDYFAHAVKQSKLNEKIDFSGSAPIIHLSDFGEAGWDTTGWTSWGNPPANFSATWGFNLTSKSAGEDSNSGFLLDVAPKDTTDFTIAFTLRQESPGACADNIEILYIGPKVAGSGDNYFHVYRAGGEIIATIGGEILTLTGYFNNAQVSHNFSFVISGSTLTAYVDGNQAGTLDNVPVISSNGDTCVVFSPFEDNNTQATYLTVDSIYFYDAALNDDDAKKLSDGAGSLEACGFSFPEGAFLTANELALLLDTRKTDNSKMGYNGYNYFVYNASDGTAEYVPLSYYTGNSTEVPHDGEANVKGAGWYYVSASGNWAKVADTTKSLYGVRGDNDTTFKDFITPNVSWVADIPRGAAPDVGEDIVEAGNSGASYTPSSNGPTKFYIDSKGYLRCFFGTSSSNPYVPNTSYVYELQDHQYVKEASLQRALGDFVTQLNEVFPQSDVAATRFSTGAAGNTTANTADAKLVLLDWTHDVTKSVGAMGQRWGSSGSVGVNGKRQYDYVLTGSTSTWTGLKAFQQHLAPHVADNEKYPEKFLIIFTDGKDTDVGTGNERDGEAKKVADALKEEGYTIFTVLLSAGTVAEGTDDYIAARNFLLSLSGTKDTTDDESRDPYFFSIHKAIKQIKDERAAQEFGGKDNGSGGIYDADVDYDGLTDVHKNVIDEWYGGLNMNMADMLTQIFSKEILSQITQPLENYVVQDYIDPRFDLVAGIATKEIDNSGLTTSVTYNSTGKNDYTLHLRVNGEIAIGNEDASEIYATVNLKDGTITNRDGYVFQDADGNPLDPNLIITQTRTSDDEDNPDPGRDPEEGEDPGAGRAPAKYYLNIHLTGASRAAIRFACLFYDEANQMYYLQWMDQTIPASTYAQTSLSVWRARITLCAKEDFLGGNAILTNGQQAHMNYVYHTGDTSASSGTERSYWADPGTGTPGTSGGGGVGANGYLSKGFPRVTVNVELPMVTMEDFDWTLWLGQTVDPSQLIEQLAESISHPIIWEDYMSRYGHSALEYPEKLKDVSLTRLIQLSTLYRLQNAISEAETPGDKAAAQAEYDEYWESLDAELQELYPVYKEYADKIKLENGANKEYNDLRRALLDSIGIERGLTYFSTNQLMAGLLDGENTIHGLYLPYAYLNAFNGDGSPVNNQAGLIGEQQRDVLGVIRYRWERVNFYNGETVENGGYFRSEKDVELKNGTPSLNQEFTIYDTRTLQYRLTATFWPFPDPSDKVWDSLIYVHDVVKEKNVNDSKIDGDTGRYADDERYEAVFDTNDEGNRIPMNSAQRKQYLADRVKEPLDELQKALSALGVGLAGNEKLEDLMVTAQPFKEGEYRKKLYNGVIEMGFSKAIWGEWFDNLDRDISDMYDMLDTLIDEEWNADYYAHRLEVRNKIAECLDDLNWFTYAVEYLEWCIGIQDTGGKFSHYDRTNDRDSFNYGVSAEDGLDPEGGGTLKIPTLIKDPDYKWTKEAVGGIQYYRRVAGSHTTRVVRGELAFEMKMDINDLEYLFAKEWRDKAEEGVTYHVKLDYDKVTDQWGEQFGGLTNPAIPEELTITIYKSDLETLRERAAVHAALPNDKPVGTLYYRMGGYSTDDEHYDPRLPDPNLAWYPKAVYDAETGEVTFYTDPRIYDPETYLNGSGSEIYADNNNYARLLPQGTYTLEPDTDKNKDDWWMFEFEDFDYAPVEHYARDVDAVGNFQIRKSHFTDNTADTNANAVRSVYAPYIDAVSGATKEKEKFQRDDNKYAPPNTKDTRFTSKLEGDEGVVFYLGTYEYGDDVSVMQYLTARVGMAAVEARLRYEMPATGGPGTVAYLAAGGLTFLMGLGLFLHRERRRRIQTACPNQTCVNRRGD